MQKRPMILLDVMIALALVILCAVPLLLKPIRIYRSELKVLEAGEGQRLADLTFAEVKESLLQNKIGWDKLPSFNKTSEVFYLKPFVLEIPERSPKQIERFFTLYCKGEKKGLGGETYRMIYVSIGFRPKLSMKKNGDGNYVYRVALKKLREDAPSNL